MVTVRSALLSLLALLLVVQCAALPFQLVPEEYAILAPRLRRNALMFSKLHRQQVWPFGSANRFEFPKRLVINALRGRDRDF